MFTQRQVLFYSVCIILQPNSLHLKWEWGAISSGDILCIPPVWFPLACLLMSLNSYVDTEDQAVCSLQNEIVGVQFIAACRSALSHPTLSCEREVPCSDLVCAMNSAGSFAQTMLIIMRVLLEGIVKPVREFQLRALKTLKYSPNENCCYNCWVLVCNLTLYSFSNDYTPLYWCHSCVSSDQNPAWHGHQGINKYKKRDIVIWLQRS